ncbi:MAG: hypothetical protein GXO40_05250 [Epsilonproteobacteria bacterium]|nr:hypothetical protein [Campylobacterota bacterium]
MKEVKASTLYFLFFAIVLLIVAFVMPLIDPNFKDYFESLYWVIVTISTVGYGDIVPHTLTSKIITIVVILLGIIAVSLFTAVVTSNLIKKTIFSLKEWEKMDNLENHLIICGYKPQLKALIDEFLKKNKRLTVKQIVVIHNVLTAEIQAMLNELDYIKFIEGDFSEEEILKQAKASKASKAIIMAEANDTSDSKVLATAILLKSFNHNIYIIAEIINPKFESYLEKIGCDEIILSEEYNKYLISKAIIDPGISRVIGSLIMNENFKIITDDYSNETFKEVFDKLLVQNIILIGVIENYGNINKFKLEYIKEAEKSPNINELYKQIHNLKNIKTNNIIISPPLDYVIQKHSALIIIERT